MAERWAVANGSWSDTGTWDGGTLPGAGDVVHANAFTVTIDQSIEVDALSIAAGGTAVAGGTFQIDGSSGASPIVIDLGLGIRAADYGTAGVTGTRKRIVNILHGAPAVTINALSGGFLGATVAYVYGVVVGQAAGNTVITPTSVGPLTINGPVSGPTAGNGQPPVRVATGANDLIVNGNVTGGTSTNTYGVDYQGTGDVTIVAADIIGGSGSSAYGVNVTGGTVDITGDVTGGSNSSAYGVNISGGTVDITGDVTGGSGGSAYGVNISGGTVDITGDVTGGSGSNAYGVNVSGSGAKNVSVNGDVQASATAEGFNATGTGTGTIRVNGSITASAAAPGLASVGYNLTISTSGPIVNHENNMSGLVAYRWTLWGEDEFEWHAHRFETPSSEDTEPWILQRFPAGSPDPEHVREGHAYGPPGDPREGTLAVPPASSVAAGVPVDDTTGTGAVLLADVAAVTGAQIAAATNAD